MNRSQMIDPHVRAMSGRDAAVAAELHRSGIHTGFLSSLGGAFLTQMYKAIPSCPSGFGYVWEEPDDDVLGFIACTESTPKVYKQALFRRGVLMALPLARFMFRPSMIRRMWQTFRYPAEVGRDMPVAEILSIVVSDGARGKGVGKALVQAALENFTRRDICRVKVAVGAGNETANEFYRRCGFELAMTRQHHGLAMNIYCIDLPAATGN